MSALPVFCSLLQETNGFIVAMGVSSNRSWKTSNLVTHSAVLYVCMMSSLINF